MEEIVIVVFHVKLVQPVLKTEGMGSNHGRIRGRPTAHILQLRNDPN